MMKSEFKNPLQGADKKAIFICQLSDTSLKVLKCLARRPFQREFIEFGIQPLSPNTDEKGITEKLAELLRKLGYKNNPVIVSLPRNSLTARYIKIPTQVPKEIKNIVALQAPRYLPYPAAELVTGYQYIQTDKEGYSHLNLIVVHRDVIGRISKIFNSLHIKNLILAPSSYGLCNLYNFFEPQETEPVLICDIDWPYLELAIALKEKLLFSRAFKISEQDSNWQTTIAMELSKTRDAYLKETVLKVPTKIVFTESARVSSEIMETVTKFTGLAVSKFSYWEKIAATPNFRSEIAHSQSSLAILAGLGLKNLPESLNLLPPEKKQEIERSLKSRENLKFLVFIGSALLMLTLGIEKNLNNKKKYLLKLKSELKKIEKEAAPLVEIERRFQFLEKHAQKTVSGLEVFSELHSITPAVVSLNNFMYDDETGQVTLRGQAPELGVVFEFVRQLEGSEIFQNFNIKVKYATQKKIQSGEVIDFEIACLKVK